MPKKVPQPAEVAAELDRNAPDVNWLRELVERLDVRLEVHPLQRFLKTWDLSLSEAAQAFDVTRQALSKWQYSGVPPDRKPALTDLDDATEELVRHLHRERIPAVVRRKAEKLGNRSLLEMVQAGEHGEVRDAVRRMFDLRRVQP